MSIIDETRFVERFQFFNGQRLFASDLQGLDEFNREMRWLHNQSLHQPGVGSGFAVNGKKGDREVMIRPGYAVDTKGREIILTETETLQVPPVAGDKGNPIYFDLAVSYPDDETLEEAETREGICGDRGVIRLQEAPVFCWIELAGDQLAPKKQKLKSDLQNGLRLRLARIAVLDCQLYADASIAERLNARPALTPYIVSGTESLSGFVIEPLVGLSAAAEFPILVIRGTVDTSAADFLTIPEYHAHLTGPRQLSLQTDGGVTVNILIVDQSQITVQERTRFESLAFALVAGDDLETQDIPTRDPAVKIKRIDEVYIQIKSQWNLVWMGIEG